MSEPRIEPLGEIQTLVGAGTSFEGKIAFEGAIRIDGTVRGEILSDGILVVGSTGSVDARIEVGALIIRGGEVRGVVTATQAVEIHAPGRLIGTVRTPELYVARGVVLDGHCTATGAKIQTLE